MITGSLALDFPVNVYVYQSGMLARSYFFITKLFSQRYRRAFLLLWTITALSEGSQNSYISTLSGWSLQYSITELALH
jgi:hypothetical protein